MTQSQIVLAIVLGCVFLFLLVANVVFGVILYAEGRRDKRRRRRRRQRSESSGRQLKEREQTTQQQTGLQCDSTKEHLTHRVQYRERQTIITKTKQQAHRDTIIDTDDIVVVPHEKETFRSRDEYQHMGSDTSPAVVDIEQPDEPTEPRGKHDVKHARGQKDAFRRSKIQKFDPEEDLSNNDSIDYKTNRIDRATSRGSRIESGCPVRLVTFSYDIDDVIPEEVVSHINTDRHRHRNRNRINIDCDDNCDVDRDNNLSKTKERLANFMNVGDINHDNCQNTVNHNQDNDEKNIRVFNDTHLLSELETKPDDHNTSIRQVDNVDKVNPIYSTRKHSRSSRHRSTNSNTTTYISDISDTTMYKEQEKSVDKVEFKVNTKKKEAIYRKNKSFRITERSSTQNDISIEIKPEHFQLSYPVAELGDSEGRRSRKIICQEKTEDTIVEEDEGVYDDENGVGSSYFTTKDQKKAFDNDNRVNDTDSHVTKTNDRKVNENERRPSRSPVLNMCISDDAKSSYFVYNSKKKLYDLKQQVDTHNELADKGVLPYTSLNDAQRVQKSHHTSARHCTPSTPTKYGNNMTSENDTDCNVTPREEPHGAISRETSTSHVEIMSRNANKPSSNSQMIENITHRVFNRPESRWKDQSVLIKGSQSENNIALAGTSSANRFTKNVANFDHDYEATMTMEMSREPHDEGRFFTAYEDEDSVRDPSHTPTTNQISLNLHHNPGYSSAVQSKARLVPNQTPTATASVLNTKIPPLATTTGASPVHSTNTPFPRPFGVHAASLYTLSEEDLKTYADTSIPTIDELVRNETERKLRHNKPLFVATGMPKTLYNEPPNSYRSQETTTKTTTTKGKETRTKVKSKRRHNVNKKAKHDRQESSIESENDKHDLIDFHTGVSDRYHSMSLQRRSSLRPKELKADAANSHTSDDTVDPNEYGNPMCDRNEIEMYARNISYSMAGLDSSVPLSSAEQHHGNWFLSIQNPRSTVAIKDAESVSSFALSDFDFGESDVDELRVNDDDDDDAQETRQDEEGGNAVNSIKDIQL